LSIHSPVHNHQQALSDHRRFTVLYRLLADLIRPKLETVIQHEQDHANSMEAMRMVSRVINHLVDGCVPSGKGSLPRREVDVAKKEIASLLENNQDLVVQEELDSLSRNIARSVINAWMTELEESYQTGMRLDAQLTPMNNEKGFIAKAMQPYHIPRYEDLVSRSMVSLGVLLASRGSSDSWVGLPLGMRFRISDRMPFSEDVFMPLTYDVMHESDSSESLRSPIDVNKVAKRSFDITIATLAGRVLFNNLITPNTAGRFRLDERSVENEVYQRVTDMSSEVFGTSAVLERDHLNNFIKDIHTELLSDAYPSVLHLSEHRSMHIQEDGIFGITDVDKEIPTEPEILYARVCVERATDNVALR